MIDTVTSLSLPNAAIVSDSQMKMILLVTMVILCGVISAFGIMVNVINMIVFYRQGLDTTINISFFSLAVSDLCSLILQQFCNIFINPLFINLDLPIVYADFQYIVASVPREMFARITCLITAFITAERCLCVVFPLHVKRIITPRVTATVVAVIYICTLITLSPLYCASYITWNFHSDSNTTLLGLVFTSHYLFVEAVSYFLHAFFTMLSFTAALVFTVILIYKLKEKSLWRQTASNDQETAKSTSKRDKATITMVVLIAGILVVCYAPAVFLCLTTFVVTDFSVSGLYINLLFSCWSIALFFENINSSVNIFVYYKMSSKYRHTFLELFSKSSHTKIVQTL